MPSDPMNVFTKENLVTYLKELARVYRRLNRADAPAEIILIGGAAILINYGFRDMTADVDAILHASSSMRDAINQVGDQFALPYGWMNCDFMRTASYSPKLSQFSTFYRTFYNSIQVRTVSAEYLIAMKLRSGRKYKNDLSDIIGIMAEHEKRGSPITTEMIDAAITDLYGGWSDISKESHNFIRNTLQHGRYEELFASIRLEEQYAENLLIDFKSRYPGSTDHSNLDDILTMLKTKKQPGKGD